jgi:hypothetical protein
LLLNNQPTPPERKLWLEKSPKNGSGESQKRIQRRIWVAFWVFFARFRFRFVEQVALDAPDIDQGS